MIKGFFIRDASCQYFHNNIFFSRKQPELFIIFSPRVIINNRYKGLPGQKEERLCPFLRIKESF
ncbi:MAG: hypothetical protein D5R97_08025 [Candidatus Syntrophonatronum acetioxidans]|uniref:Uncharacterized protein n=1 Tax=Candidatus Syntrophonatronum acetioxidans TaxID=1795816 RepID=A0A424YBJ5_9FIRM|nr:MAG: hypothetical protein D5R97_08025 [Candidatus Syntrophonatronum acetioxidans]